MWTSAAVVDVQENNADAFYTLKASGAVVSYGLKGLDAAKFMLNPSSGELRFIAAPNFEVPVDSDGNNRYQITLEAKYADQTLSQDLTVTVKDVVNGKVSVVFPADNSSIDDVEAGDFTVAARFDETEAHIQKADTVTANGHDLEKSATDPNLWVGKIDITTPAEQRINIIATFGDKTVTSQSVVRNTLVSAPVTLALDTAANRILYFDGYKHAVKRFNFKTDSIADVAPIPFAYRASLNPYLLAYDAVNNFSYGVTPYQFAADGTPRLQFARASISAQKVVSYYAVNDVTSMVLDTVNERALLLEHVGVNNQRRALVSAIDIKDKTDAPVFSYKEIWRQADDGLYTNIDQLAFDAKTNTLLLADKLGASTKIYGINATTGAVKFNVVLGPRISRIEVDASAALAYVAEHATPNASLSLQAINLADGQATKIDLASFTGDVALAGITDLRLDAANKKIYVASDKKAIVVLDLVAKQKQLIKSFGVAEGVALTPSALVWDKLTAKLYAADGARGSLVSIDASNGKRAEWRAPRVTANNEDFNTIGFLSLNFVDNLLVTLEKPAQSASGLFSLVTTDLLNKISDEKPATQGKLAATGLDYLWLAGIENPSYAIVRENTQVRLVNTTTGALYDYGSAADFGLNAAEFSAVTVDAKNAIAYAIKQQPGAKTGQLVALDVSIRANAEKVPTVLVDNLTVEKPTDLKIDALHKKAYYVDGPVFYAVDMTAKTTSRLSATVDAVPSVGNGTMVLGERFTLDVENQIAWFSQASGGAIIAVSLSTGDRVVVSH